MKFKSRKDIWHKLIFYGFSLIFLLPIIFIWLEPEETLLGKLGLSLFMLAVIGLMLWISFQTKYSLENNYFHYQSGPIRGKIPIQSIRKLEINKTMWVGILKPATSFNGIILHYNTYDEIYISPDSNEQFVEEILKLNPQIELEKNA